MGTGNKYIRYTSKASAGAVFAAGGGKTHCRMFTLRDGTYLVKVPWQTVDRLTAANRDRATTLEALITEGVWPPAGT